MVCSQDIEYSSVVYHSVKEGELQNLRVQTLYLSSEIEHPSRHVLTNNGLCSVGSEECETAGQRKPGEEYCMAPELAFMMVELVSGCLWPISLTQVLPGGVCIPSNLDGIRKGFWEVDRTYGLSVSSLFWALS